MADSPCNLVTLQRQLPCLECLSKSEKMAALAYLLALTYSTIAEVEMGETLRQEVMCFSCEPSPRLDDFLVQIAMNLAVNEQAIQAPLTAAELREAIKCWLCGIGEKELKAIIVMALCGLVNEITGSRPQ